MGLARLAGVPTCAAVVILAACGGGAKQSAAPPETARYVGSEACRSCHAETWSTFSRTGMGRSWYPLAGAEIIEDWSGRNTVDVARTGLHYAMFRRGERFFMRQSLVDRGRETAVDERELLWVVGSAHHSRAYLVAWDEKLFQAPVCWFTKDALWDLCPGYEMKNDYFSREIDRTCVFCHNGRMTLRPDSRNAYEDPIPHGINCERCHGPGSLHVARWARGETPTGTGDPAVVNPRRLSTPLRMQICFQCHLGDSKATERVARREVRLEDWRPGQPITDAMVPFRFSETTPHEYGLSAQVDRLLLSRCFTESAGKMECVTCHDPHVTVYRADRGADFFTAKCLGCHDPHACTAPQATRAKTRPPDDCVQCHMRKAEPDDHRHAVFTDHWIRRRIDEPNVPRTRFGVEPYLPDAYAALPPADRAFYTARALSLRAHAVPPENQKSIWPGAEKAFRESIALGLGDPAASFFLGKALSAQGKHREAAEAYAAAYAADPADHDAALAHGQALLRARHLDEAERVLQAAIDLHPEAAGPLAELARARFQRGDVAAALALYRKALRLEPWNASLHENAAMLLSALARHDEAVAEAEEALRFDPESPGVRRSNATIRQRASAAR
ncbi:MAG TPA: tetratricopeptide repeat protein [Candidatus Polarisedimenticolaceae bacterium]|nr:tetratricopeptide repeat protein [Candidatus Polarisedimenticolaceae bacterium]